MNWRSMRGLGATPAASMADYNAYESVLKAALNAINQIGPGVTFAQEQALENQYIAQLKAAITDNPTYLNGGIYQIKYQLITRFHQLSPTTTSSSTAATPANTAASVAAATQSASAATTGVDLSASGQVSASSSTGLFGLSDIELLGIAAVGVGVIWWMSSGSKRR